MLFRTKLHHILRPSEDDGWSSKSVDLFLAGLIVINVIAVVFGTIGYVEKHYSWLLEAITVFSMIVFTIEYLLRIWTAVDKPGYEKSFKGRLKYVFSPMAVIDFLAIIPFYLPMIIGVDLRVLRVFRLLRMLVILKLGRYSKTLKIISRVFRLKREELILSFIFVGFLLLISASVVYYAEHKVQPEKFSSIVAALWWGVVSLTTVGYGDVVPVTLLGKLFSSIISLMCIGVFALPTGIISAGFLQVVNEDKDNKCCPHCGKEI